MRSTDVPLFPPDSLRGQWYEFYVKRWMPFVAESGFYWAYQRLSADIPSEFPRSTSAQADFSNSYGTSFTTAGKAALRSGDWRIALEAWDEIQRRGLAHEHGDVKAAIAAATVGKRWEHEVARRFGKSEGWASDGRLRAA